MIETCAHCGKVGAMHGSIHKDGETRVFLLSGQDTSKWEHIFKGFKNG